MADGGFLEFMSYDQDLDKFAGTSRHFCWFDEEPPAAIFTECLLRLVDTGGSYWVTMTPVEGMTWVYDSLYEPAKTGLDENKLVVEVEMMMNPHINAEEADFILAGLTPDERKARELGQFVQIGGLIYPQWKPELHMIRDPEFTVPSSWMKFNAMDHGYNNPTAWGWYAVSPDGVIVKYDEHYEAGKLVGHHARIVHEKNTEHGIIPAYNVGDRTIANTDSITGTSIQIEYMEHGIPIALAGGSNDVKAGINRVGRYLQGTTATLENGEVIQVPKFYIVASRCPKTAWEFSRYRWAVWATKKMQFDKNKKEEPQKKDDHAMDETRYAICSRPEIDNGTETPEFRAPVEHSTAVSSYGDEVDRELISSGGSESNDFHLGSEF
jgi:phage terminase large subunit-like protein